MMSHKVNPLQSDESVKESPDVSRRELIHSDRSLEVSKIFGPILKMMMITGLYFGETTLVSIPRHGVTYFGRWHCAFVALCQWLLVPMAGTSLVLEGTSSMGGFFFLLILTAWYLQCALFTTICLVVLPVTQGGKSRLAQFLASCVATPAQQGDMRKKVKLGLIVACAVVLVTIIMQGLLEFHQGMSVSRFRPWNERLVFHIVGYVFAIPDTFAWCLPLLLFCVTCQFLADMMEHLHQTLSEQVTAGSVDVAGIRKEYLKLCDTIALADKVFSPMMLVLVSLDIPLICVNFYQFIRIPRSVDNIVELAVILYWAIGVGFIVTLVIVFGTKVSGKANVFFDTLQKVEVAKLDDNGKTELLLFVMHLNGEPVGLTVGGLTVINKTLFVTLVGIIVSYFAVLITLPNT